MTWGEDRNNSYYFYLFSYKTYVLSTVSVQFNPSFILSTSLLCAPFQIVSKPFSFIFVISAWSFYAHPNAATLPTFHQVMGPGVAY